MQLIQLNLFTAQLTELKEILVNVLGYEEIENNRAYFTIKYEDIKIKLQHRQNEKNAVYHFLFLSNNFDEYLNKINKIKDQEIKYKIEVAENKILIESSEKSTFEISKSDDKKNAFKIEIPTKNKNQISEFIENKLDTNQINFMESKNDSPFSLICRDVEDKLVQIIFSGKSLIETKIS